MKAILTFLTILLSTVTIFSQDENLKKIPFISYWSIGDSYDFKITKIKQDWREGQLTKNDSSSYIANFEVLDSTATSYKIKWSHESNLMGNYNLSDEYTEQLSKYKNFDIIYTTSEVGEFLGIENWKEISEMMQGLFTDLSALMVDDSKIDQQKFNDAMKPLLSIYSSKEGIEGLLYKELHYFHFPFGVEYIEDETFEYEDALPSLLGGKPIRGDVKLYIKSVDYEEYFCELIQEMTLNPDDTKKLISKLFKQMKLSDKELKKAMKTAVFEIKDYNSYQYYYYPGVPYFIETNRTTVMDMGKEKGKRIELNRIELIFEEEE